MNLARALRGIALGVLVGNGAWLALASDSEEAARSTVVVYNRADPESAKLAQFYAERRAIAKDRLIGLDCSPTEEISRAEYDHQIADPLREKFEANGWWRRGGAGNSRGPVEGSQVRFVALIRGIPLRIAGTHDYPGDQAIGPETVRNRNDASVDSELTVLGLFSSQLSGALENPYYRSYLRIAEAKVPAMLLVGRLDGPNPQVVRRMIEDSLAAEARGLDGIVYLDGRGIKEGALAEGDQWLNKAAQTFRRDGFPVIFDERESMFAAGFPMREAAVYLGWYDAEMHGPMASGRACFVPGAIAVHIHSFSAATLHDEHRGWCGPLLAAGAAATVGNVAEPYLALTPNLAILTERLRAGFTFAESAWMSQRVLSWMTTVIGDPLYRPFPVEQARNPQEFEIEGRAWRQMEAGENAAALDLFRQAQRRARDPLDGLRAAVGAVECLRRSGRVLEARTLLQEQLERFPKSPTADWLRALAAEMATAKAEQSTGNTSVTGPGR